MAIRLGQKHSGFTLFEFAISAGVLAILAGLLVVRAQFYEQEAERLSAQQMAGTLRLALKLRAAQMRQHEGERGLERLLEENPLDWLT